MKTNPSGVAHARAASSERQTTGTTVSCSPEGFPNVLSAAGGWEVQILQPAFVVALECSNEPVPQEGPAAYDALFVNTGDADLVVTADQGIGTFTLAVGESSLQGVVEDEDERPLQNALVELRSIALTGLDIGTVASFRTSVATSSDGRRRRRVSRFFG